MSGGEIAGLILAGSFALLVLLIGVPLVKLGKVLDETAQTVKTVNRELEPMLGELKTTLTETNKQLQRIDHITRDVESATENISSLVAVFTSSIASPLTRIAGIAQGVFGLLRKK
jgi:uncharacterized protein YoxC